jgi:diaminopimelate epimerase
METFYKYQSLGNDFILIDAFNKSKKLLNEKISSANWKNFVINSCKRNFGVGADGVLVLTKSHDNKNNKQNINQEVIPELLIFNSDGSQAEICLNGLRCAVLHLHEYHDIEKSSKIKMGKKIINFSINKNIITTQISELIYSGIKNIIINNNQEIMGHVVSVGNPHFIIEKQVTPEWVLINGKSIESHPDFINKTNVEFITPAAVILNSFQDPDKKTKSINVLVYERGVGPTLACSSGAAAITEYLYQTQKINILQKITLNFLGGQVNCFIDKDKQVNLQAHAKLVFKGQI